MTDFKHFMFDLITGAFTVLTIALIAAVVIYAMASIASLCGAYSLLIPVGISCCWALGHNINRSGL